MGANISIHVPREGHDPLRNYWQRETRISIHVPREGHDQPPDISMTVFMIFQSTCPARGTTFYYASFSSLSLVFQSTCPARGTTSHLLNVAVEINIFQSTCPARGTTHWRGFDRRRQRDFNPRAPRGARRVRGLIHEIAEHISIHVPREGHDISLEVISTIPIDFNPRAPRGARLAAWDGIKTFFTISIHVPREGHD